MFLRILLVFSIVVSLGAGVGIWLTQGQSPAAPVTQVNNIEQPVPVPSEGLLRSKPTNFGALGTLSFEGRTPYLLFLRQRVELQLDELSVCASPNGGIACMAMSVLLNVPFHGKAAIVEGEMAGGKVLVRKMQVVENIAGADAPTTGHVYMPWAEARRLMMACEVSTALQTRTGDLDLTLKNGNKVRTVEPIIGEVFRVLDEGARTSCPSLAVATE